MIAAVAPLGVKGKMVMVHKLGFLHRNQRGVTAIELLIAVAISGLIFGAAATTIFQTFDGMTRDSNFMTAVRQVQNAGYWVSHDAQMSQTISPGASSGFPLTLTRLDWYRIEHRVVYTLEDMPSGGLKNLIRSQYTDGVLDETSPIAQSIDPTATNCALTASGSRLPDIGDECTITDGTGGDSGIIIVNTGSISVTLGGTATYNAATGDWATPTAGDTVAVAAVEVNTSVEWTSSTGTATAAITTDSDGDVTFTEGGQLVFTVTATVGTDRQQRSETRIYQVVSRPE